MKKKVAVAGATSYIGRWFIDRFKSNYEILALSRREIKNDSAQIQWRQTDLYSYTSTLEALKDADYAVYLVHSRQPSARLNQTKFDDTDLLLADNFARAAEKNKVKHIVFVGGLLPDQPEVFNKHLRNRKEVEMTLGSRSVPLTSIRAGLLIGPGSLSLLTMQRLITRLPVLACPAWCNTPTHPVGIEDVVDVIGYCLGKTDLYHQAFEIGQREPISYLEMLKITAAKLKKKRWIFSLPFSLQGLSKFWMAIFAGSSRLLVAPVVDSLRHDLKVKPNRLLDQFPRLRPFTDVIETAFNAHQPIPETPDYQSPSTKKANNVRSVQRLPNPGNHTATWVANRYQTWLPRFFRVFLKVISEGDYATFQLLGFKLLKLQLIRDRSDHSRQLFYVIDGILVRRKDFGWLEFRKVLGGKYVISALHEFVPALPWYLYVNTQALAHLWIMKRFGAYLGKLRMSKGVTAFDEKDSGL